MDLLEYEKVWFLLYRRQSSSSCGGFERGCQRHPCSGDSCPNQHLHGEGDRRVPTAQCTGKRGALTIAQSWGSALGRRTDTNSPRPGHGGMGMEVCTWSKGFWEPRTLPIHQPRLGRRCSGEVFSPEDWAPQQSGCSEHKRKRFPGPTEGVRERTGRQELRVRAKGKGGPAGPAPASQREP